MYKDKWIKGRKYQVLTDEAQAWADEFVIRTNQAIAKNRWQTTVKTKVIVNLWFYFPDHRKRDTHNGIKLIMDCLEQAGVYDNDRYALPRIQDWEVDKDHPRIEIEIIKFTQCT